MTTTSFLVSFVFVSLIMKCSFCEQPLLCKACGQPFRPPSAEAHVAVYQRDMAIPCPLCQELLICKACGFVYGEEEEDEDET